MRLVVYAFALSRSAFSLAWSTGCGGAYDGQLARIPRNASRFTVCDTLRLFINTFVKRGFSQDGQRSEQQCSNAKVLSL
jgi:hypothetical protein